MLDSTSPYCHVAVADLYRFGTWGLRDWFSLELSSLTEEVVTGGIYVPPPGYYNFWPDWNMANGQFYATSSYLTENTIVRAEFNLYNARSEKLIWNCETDTLYSKDFGKLGKDYANTLVKQLKRDKVITKK
jgi:hypothetical protein